MKVLFGPSADALQTVSVVLTLTLLVWGTLTAKSKPVVLAVRLAEVEISDYTSSLIPDSGLEVLGFFNDAAERGRVFIGLGGEPAAEKFRAAVKQATARLRA
jgi:hypothetical protein